MSTKIIPTVGRVVWFYPAANQATSGFAPPAEGQPLAAIIARVVDADADVVHLAVFDGVGASCSEPYVQIIQEGETAPETGRYATWMPYQIGQAKKRAEEPKVGAMLQCSSQIMGTGARDDAYLRAQALEMALRTPGIGNHLHVLRAAEAYQAHIAGEAGAAPDVKQMVDRFLGWPLPKTFSPDCGISFDGRGPDARGYAGSWPIGTNLLNAEEARAMFEYVLGHTAG
jgi:hypothetical protein